MDNPQTLPFRGGLTTVFLQSTFVLDHFFDGRCICEESKTEIGFFNLSKETTKATSGKDDAIYTMAPIDGTFMHIAHRRHPYQLDTQHNCPESHFHHGMHLAQQRKKNKMVFGGIVSSPRAYLTAQQALELANVYLDNAINAKDADISMVLCHDTEVSLSQAKKSIKHTENQILVDGITAAYMDLGKLLERYGHDTEAQASYKKAEKLG